MKLKLLIIPILLFVFACQNTSKEQAEETNEPTESKEQPAVAHAAKVQINIKGMTCTGCENAIKKTINEFDGVYTSESDFEKGTAIVKFDSTEVDISKVEQAINELGYEATGHKRLEE